MIAKKSAQLPPRAEWESWRREFLPVLSDAIRYKPVKGPLGVRPLITTARKGYRVEKVEFLSEPGIYIPTWTFVPQRRNAYGRAILYVNDTGVAEEGADGMEFNILERLARKGYLVVAVEPRGTGLTTAQHFKEAAESHQFGFLFNVETAAAYMAWFMDQSLLGMRVLDVLRGVDYALGRQDVDKRGLAAVGVGRGATWLLFAAALDKRIQAAVCDRGLVSYKSLVQADHYRYAADMFLPGVLKRFDLPQVAAAIADRPLTLLAPVGPMKQTVALRDAEIAYEWTRKVHARFRIEQRTPDVELEDQYLRALGSKS